jgi:hypothetical protein
MRRVTLKNVDLPHAKLLGSRALVGLIYAPVIDAHII